MQNFSIARRSNHYMVLAKGERILVAKTAGLDGVDGVFVRVGAVVADELLVGNAGDGDSRSGWRGTLRIASELSRGDQGVLTVADLVNAEASTLTTPAAVLVFAEANAPTISTRAGRLLLLGMLDRVAYD